MIGFMRSSPLLIALFAPLTAFSQTFNLVWSLDIPVANTLGTDLADIDGDGDLDAYLGSGVGNSVLVVNDGNGQFELLAGQPTLPSEGSCAFGDIDGDGDQDLIAGSFFGPCKVFLNDGSGGFTDSGQAVGTNSVREDLLLLDLDNDSDLDLVIPTNTSTDPNEIWLNDGNGTFSDSGQNLGEFFTISAAAGDLDGDGDPDLIMGNNGTNTVWFNDGSANFTQGTSLPLFGTTLELKLADLDGDNDLDVFVVNGSISGQLNHVHLNNGSGVFTNLAQPNFVSDFGTALHLDDFDGDGDVDAYVARNRALTNQLWVNNGSGVFSLDDNDLGPGGAFDLGIGDLDGDLDEDILIVCDGAAPRVLLREPIGSGGPLVLSPTAVAGSQAASATEIDYDLDGDLDVALGNIGGTLTFLENDGSGSFSDPGTVLNCNPGNTPIRILSADLDGQNGPDLVVFCSQYSGQADGQDEIFFNDGSGNFTAAAEFLDSELNGSIAIGDVDGDGDPDIITINQTSFSSVGQNSLFINNGSGSFVRSDAFGQGNQRAVALLDVDDDSDLDVFIGGVDSSTPADDTDDSLWLNNGSGVFTDSGLTLGGGSPTKAIAADLNGDGDDDLFVIDRIGGNRLWLSNGAGNLSSTGVNIGSGFATDAEPLDYDGDGDLDLWFGAGGFSPSPDSVRINDGSGSFSFSSDTFPAISTSEVIARDFTGDGTIDVFVASSRGRHQLYSADTSPVSIWANGFGLTGADAFFSADPDDDLIPNFLEMAYNMNPSVADATRLSPTGVSGLPRLEYKVSTGLFEITTIRRKNAAFLNYLPKRSPDLASFSTPPSVTENASNIDADYERVIFSFPAPPGASSYFGRLEIEYDP